MTLLSRICTYILRRPADSSSERHCGYSSQHYGTDLGVHSNYEQFLLS